MNRLTAPLTTVIATALRTLVGAMLLLCTANAQAFGLASLLNAPDPSWGFINNRQLVSGYVYTRGIYKNDQGYPVYVEYNAQGEEVAEIGPLDPNGPYGNTRIMAAREYQAYVEQYEADLQQFRDTYPNTDEPELLTLSAYQSRIGTLTTATEPGEPWTGTDADTNLNPGTRSVLVRPQSLLYTPESPYLMRQYPIDMTGYQSMAGQTGSLLIDRNGQIVRTSQYRIALRAVYYENPNASTPQERFESSSFVSGFIRSQGTVPTLTNPVQTLPLSTGWASLGAASTNEAGKYSMMITAVPCPTFFYQYTESVSGQVPYRAFNPDISGGYHYPVTRTFQFICNGMATYSFQPGTNPPITLDFPIDVNILTGAIRVPGVELAAPGTPPVYDLEAPDAFTQTQADYYDFDLDGTPDTTNCGVQDENGLFVQEADCQIATVQGVYLSSAPNDPNGEGCNDDPSADLCQPNLLRVIDLEQVQEDKALVSQLAPEHLKDTDLFIIRKATGQLIAQRQGLKDDEAAYEPAGPDGLVDNDLNLAESELRIDYGMIMRGVQDLSFQYGTFAAMREEGGFSDWQAKGNMAPELYAHRTADQVRAGETLEVWAINRVTGYLGHAEIVVGEDQLSDGLLDTKVPDIELAAPNLKIWAERRYNIEAGLTKDEQRDYLISHEGAGEGDDTFIQIFVEWLDQDGSALPDALKDYGYTGRLAYVSGENTLSDASQAGQARFNIQPGKHSELLRLPSTSDNNLHYYVQVNGIPYNDYTDFALGDQNRSGDVSFEGTPENEYRPERFVPIKTPQYDAPLSELQEQAYHQTKLRALVQGVSDDDSPILKPQPLYNWLYRPEYQFSIYDLTMHSITAQRVDEDDGTVDIDWLNNDQPILTSQDLSLLILAGLGGPELDPLPRFDGEQTLILAFGEEELALHLSSHNTLSFSNIGHLSKLESSDYLTLRLYTNGDEQNLLWQYAFGTFGLASDENRDGRIVTSTNFSRHINEPEQSISPAPDEPAGPVSLEALIDSANSKDNPMRIWLNDDGDYKEVQGGGDHTPFPESVSYFWNAANNKVDGTSDLIDFFPVFLDIESALKSIEYFNHTYVLKDTTESLNFFEAYLPTGDSILQPDQPNTIHNFDALQKHPGIATLYANKAVTPITTEGVELSDEFLFNAQNGKGGIVMIEAKKATPIDQPLPLMLEIRERETNVVVASETLWIQARPVHEMFRQLDMTNIPDTRRPQDIDGLAYPNNNDPIALPDTLTEADYFVFLHGFNVSGQDGRGWLGETFKRLYRSGFDGRFVGVAWHGFPDNFPPDYHSMVYNAFVTSQHLPGALQPYLTDASSVTIAAHSLGNLVVSNAMAKFELDADRYFMINAAVPMEAYDAGQETATTIRLNGEQDMADHMREIDWVEYSKNDADIEEYGEDIDFDFTYASDWHRLFEVGDPRRSLTWRDRFKDVLNVTYNFYSPGDHVLKNSRGSTSVLWAGLWEETPFINEAGSGSWYMQAIGKGCQSELFGLANHPCQGGYEFNTDTIPSYALLGVSEATSDAGQYKGPQEIKAMFADPSTETLLKEELAQFGFFRPFIEDYSNLYAPITEGNFLYQNEDYPPVVPTQADMRDLMDQPETTWQLLATAIPERSFAAGANSLTVLSGDIFENKPDRNFNLHDYRFDMEGGNGVYWPTERRSSKETDLDWLHSDMIGIAYPYVQPLFQEMVILINE